MSATGVETDRSGHGLMRSRLRDLGRYLAGLPVWLWVGTGACILVVTQGTAILNDTDTLWQIKVGQWIMAHHDWPRVDVYSLTKAGAPWMSSSWLSQVLFAATYAVTGWSGVVMLTALAIAATFALLAHILERRMSTVPAFFVAAIAFALTSHHFLARPHVLAMPIMLAWVAGLIAASDRGIRPSWRLLPLLMLWANLHGGFVLGLALVGPIALDALWNARDGERKALAAHWALFGLAALVACCVTPYGWHSLLAVSKILGLGGVLTEISEWAPVSFATFGLFQACLLLSIGAALYSGVALTPTRILLVLGLLYMALSHVRNIEVLVLLLPVVLLAPLAGRFTTTPGRPRSGQAGWSGSLAIAAVMLVAVSALATVRSDRPAGEHGYEAAIAALKQHDAKRVFNEYAFGGYMIWVGMPPFVDGRAELYGEKFLLDHLNAVLLKEPDAFFRLLDTYNIDATVLFADTPAAKLLDHLDSWSKVFSSDFAVVHIRTRPPGPTVSKPS